MEHEEITYEDLIGDLETLARAGLVTGDMHGLDLDVWLTPLGERVLLVLACELAANELVKP